jgi:uncharacterized membrane protein
MTPPAYAAEASTAPQLRPPPRNRMVVAVLALIGLFVSLYLLAYSVGLVPLICGVGSCAYVQASEWSTVGPIPVPLIGVGGYSSLLAATLYALQPAQQERRGPGLVVLGLATIGVAYSAFLTYLEARVINAWCMWCVVSAVLMTLIFLASLPELSRRRASA